MVDRVNANELIVTRYLAAPPELVFCLWTSPEHVSEWWGPKGFTTTTHQFDLRPCGVWRMTMHGPDGRDYESQAEFIEVERPDFLRYRHRDVGEKDAVDFISSISFARLGEGTLLTIRSTFQSPDDLLRVEAAYGAAEGLYETMGRFCGYLSKLKTPADPLQPRSKRELVCDAHFETPVDRVFSAFRDPAQLAAWWGPEGFTNTFHFFEFVEGGKWTLTMHGPDARDYPNELSFVEIHPPYRLVIEHPTSPHFIAEFDLVPLDQGTRLVMHQVFDSDDECQRIAEYAGNGNSEMFERLRALLKT